MFLPVVFLLCNAPQNFFLLPNCNLAPIVFHNGCIRLYSHQECTRSLFIHILTNLLYNSHSYFGECLASSFNIHFSNDYWYQPFFICRLSSYTLSLEKCLYTHFSFSTVFFSYYYDFGIPFIFCTSFLAKYILKVNLFILIFYWLWRDFWVWCSHICIVYIVFPLFFWVLQKTSLANPTAIVLSPMYSDNSFTHFSFIS